MSWEEARLDDVCDLITCGVAKRPEYVDDGVPFLSSTNVKENRFLLDSYKYVSQKDYQQLTKYSKPRKGDILYTRVGSFGEAAVIDFDMDFAIFVSLTLIKPKRELLDSRYLMWYLNSPKIRALANHSTSGIGVQNLNVGVVREYKVPVPPMSVQKQIADTLDKADAIRRKDQQLLQKYDELAQSIFYKMFGDLETNNRNFKIVPLGELVNIPNKLVDPRNEPFSQLLHVGGDNIESATGKIFNLKRADELGLKSGKFLFDETCILYNKIRPYLNKVALPDFKGVCSADMYPLIPNGRVNKLFLFYVLRSKDFLSFVSNQARRANIPKINREELSQYRCVLPPLNLQNEFAAALSNIRQQVEMAELQKTGSTRIFSSLLTSYFSN